MDRKVYNEMKQMLQQILDNQQQQATMSARMDEIEAKQTQMENNQNILDARISANANSIATNHVINNLLP